MLRAVHPWSIRYTVRRSPRATAVAGGGRDHHGVRHAKWGCSKLPRNRSRCACLRPCPVKFGRSSRAGGARHDDVAKGLKLLKARLICAFDSAAGPVDNAEIRAGHRISSYVSAEEPNSIRAESLVVAGHQLGYNIYSRVIDRHVGQFSADR